VREGGDSGSVGCGGFCTGRGVYGRGGFGVCWGGKGRSEEKKGTGGDTKKKKERGTDGWGVNRGVGGRDFFWGTGGVFSGLGGVGGGLGFRGNFEQSPIEHLCWVGVVSRRFFLYSGRVVVEGD